MNTTDIKLYNTIVAIENITNTKNKNYISDIQKKTNNYIVDIDFDYVSPNGLSYLDAVFKTDNLNTVKSLTVDVICKDCIKKHCGKYEMLFNHCKFDNKTHHCHVCGYVFSKCMTISPIYYNYFRILDNDIHYRDKKDVISLNKNLYHDVIGKIMYQRDCSKAIEDMKRYLKTVRLNQIVAAEKIFYNYYEIMRINYDDEEIVKDLFEFVINKSYHTTIGANHPYKHYQLVVENSRRRHVKEEMTRLIEISKETVDELIKDKNNKIIFDEIMSYEDKYKN